MDNVTIIIKVMEPENYESTLKDIIRQLMRNQTDCSVETDLVVDTIVHLSRSTDADYVNDFLAILEWAEINVEIKQSVKI